MATDYVLRLIDQIALMLAEILRYENLDGHAKHTIKLPTPVCEVSVSRSLW